MSTALAPITTSAAPRLAALPTPVDKKALESYLKAIEDPGALELQTRLAAAYDAACKALIGPNDIQKEGDREFKKKSAWRKLQRYFGISTEVVAREHEIIGEEFVVTITVRGVSPWGQATDAVGACGTDEEKGRRKITMADAIATAQTRASNRAISDLIAMGEVSAEEVAKNQVAQESVRDITLEDARTYPFPWRTPEKYAGKPMGNLSYNMLETVRDAIAKEIEKKGETPKRLELRRVCQLLMEEIESRDDGDGVEGEQRENPTSTSSTDSSATPSSASSSGSTTSPASAAAATGPLTPAAASPDDEDSFADEFDGDEDDVEGYGEELAPASREEPQAPPAKGAADSLYALQQRFNQLVEHPELAAFRDKAKNDMRAARKDQATYPKWLREHVSSMEQLLAGALDPEELKALGISPAASAKKRGTSTDPRR